MENFREFSGDDQVILTPRLRLVTMLPHEYLRLVDNKAPENLWEHRGLHNPYRHLVDNGGPLYHRAPRVAKDPSYAPLGLRLAVLREESKIVGSFGFHAFPNELGMIEIGLEIVPQYQRQGLAYEGLVAMWRWIIQRPDVRTLRYTVSPTNTPSIALVKKFGFDFVGVQMDEEDGPEDIYELSAEELARRL